MPARKETPGLLYVKARDRLAHEIASGARKPGSPLPNEADLAKDFGVSLGTLRRALEMLEGERLIARYQGRGTFVRDHSDSELAIRFSNIRDAAGTRISGDSTDWASSIVPANEDECTSLEVTSADHVLRSTRVRRHNNRSFMYEEASLAIQQFADFASVDISVPYNISELAHNHGVLLGTAVEKVSIADPAPERVGAIASDPGTPLLMLDRIIYSIEGDPVEWRLAYCELGDLQYVADLG